MRSESGAFWIIGACILTLLLLPLKLSAESQESPSVEEIVSKAMKVTYLTKGTSQSALITMTLVGPTGHKKERQMQIISKNYGEGNAKMLLRFLSPPDVKGTGFLVWVEKGKEDQQFLYLPALRRTTPVAGNKRGDNFMGSDFSYYDLSSHDMDKEKHKLLEEKKHEGADCYVIETIPQDIETYGKIISRIRKEDYIPLNMQLFNPGGELIKEAFFKNFKVIGGINTPTQIEMRHIKNRTSTILEISDIKYDIDIPDANFTRRYLERGL